MPGSAWPWSRGRGEGPQQRPGQGPIVSMLTVRTYRQPPCWILRVQGELTLGSVSELLHRVRDLDTATRCWRESLYVILDLDEVKSV